MAHFAQLDENNVVIDVIVVGDNDTSDINGVEVESIGVAFCQKLFGAETTWKQTSYNDSIRFRFAGIGYSYNAELNAFVPPQPHVSWILDNSTADWVSPLGSEPTLTDDQIASGSRYIWDESIYQSDNTEGWVLETPPSE